jgi:hypothetical protein
MKDGTFIDSSAEYADTYVICYTKPANLWVAFNIRTRQVSIGSCPKEALANGINAADQVVKSATRYSDPHVSNASYELMLTLAETAQPLPKNECTPGVIYKHEWAWSPSRPQHGPGEERQQPQARAMPSAE